MLHRPLGSYVATIFGAFAGLVVVGFSCGWLGFALDKAFINSADQSAIDPDSRVPMLAIGMLLGLGFGIIAGPGLGVWLWLWRGQHEAAGQTAIAVTGAWLLLDVLVISFSGKLWLTLCFLYVLITGLARYVTRPRSSPTE